MRFFENPAEYHFCKDRLFGSVVSRVMKQSRGKASPAMVDALLKMKLAG